MPAQEQHLKECFVDIVCRKLQQLELHRAPVVFGTNCEAKSLHSHLFFTRLTKGRTFSTSLAAMVAIDDPFYKLSGNTVFFLLTNVQQVDIVFKTLVKMLFLVRHAALNMLFPGYALVFSKKGRQGIREVELC